MILLQWAVCWQQQQQRKLLELKAEVAALPQYAQITSAGAAGQAYVSLCVYKPKHYVAEGIAGKGEEWRERDSARYLAVGDVHG